jgi:hypothetical protein
MFFGKSLKLCSFFQWTVAIHHGLRGQNVARPADLVSSQEYGKQYPFDCINHKVIFSHIFNVNFALGHRFVDTILSGFNLTTCLIQPEADWSIIVCNLSAITLPELNCIISKI